MKGVYEMATPTGNVTASFKTVTFSTGGGGGGGGAGVTGSSTSFLQPDSNMVAATAAMDMAL